MQLESELSVRLFNRTTRRIAITQAGKAYYQQALDLLDRFDALQDTLRSEQSTASGNLRITTSQTFAEEILYPLLPGHPPIQFQLSALFPSRTYLPEKTRIFLDFIQQHVVRHAALER